MLSLVIGPKAPSPRRVPKDSVPEPENQLSLVKCSPFPAIYDFPSGNYLVPAWGVSLVLGWGYSITPHLLAQHIAHPGNPNMERFTESD